MLKYSVAASLSDIDKPDHRHLIGRFVLNVGNNVVRIEPDLSFEDYLRKNGKKPINTTIIKPGEQAWVGNLFVVVFTDNHERATLEFIGSSNRTEVSFESRKN